MGLQPAAPECIITEENPFQKRLQLKSVTRYLTTDPLTPYLLVQQLFLTGGPRIPN